MAQPARGRLERHGHAARRLPRPPRPEDRGQQVDQGGGQHVHQEVPPTSQHSRVLTMSELHHIY